MTDRRDDDPAADGEEGTNKLSQSYSYPLLSSAYNKIRSQQQKREQKERLCQHTLFGFDCVSNCLIKGFMRTFAVAYGFKTGLSCGLALIRGRLFKKDVLRNIFFGQDAIRFGQFIACMSGVYKAIICILRRLRKKNSPYHSAIAGFIAGHAIMLDDPSRRATMALFVAVRAIDDAIRLLIHYKKVKPIAHLPVYLFALCQVPIMFTFLHYPHCLDSGYRGWITRMGNFKNDDVVKHTFRSSIEGPYRKEFEKFVPCSQWYHRGEESCAKAQLTDFLHGLRRAARIYIPVHFIPTLLFRPKSLAKDPLKYFETASVNTFWSSMFLSTYQTVVKYTSCVLRNYFHDDLWWFGTIGGLLTGPALLFEHPKRHSELLLYVLPRAITAVYRLFPEQSQVLEKIPNGLTLLFCFGLSLFMVCYDMNHKAMKRLNQSGLRLVYGSVSKS